MKQKASNNVSPAQPISRNEKDCFRERNPNANTETMQAETKEQSKGRAKATQYATQIVTQGQAKPATSKETQSRPE